MSQVLRKLNLGLQNKEYKRYFNYINQLCCAFHGKTEAIVFKVVTCFIQLPLLEVVNQNSSYQTLSSKD